MIKNSRRSGTLAVTCLCALSLGACGGVTKFSDATAIAIRGPAPTPVAPPEQKRVEVKKDRIDIAEKIQFDLDKATIKPESHDLLNEITKVFADNPQIKKVDVVGHTSSEGDDRYNQSLSEKRAASVVEYLTSHGIDASRLSSLGMGENQPLSDNKTEAKREVNRRVEFLIVEQDLSAGDS